MIEPASADERQVGGDHYHQIGIQPWAVMESVLSHQEFIGYLKGNIIKYSMRAGRKEGSDDASKAWHYKQKLAEFLNHQEHF
jgi:hypothetical protein